MKEKRAGGQISTSPPTFTLFRIVVIIVVVEVLVVRLELFICLDEFRDRQGDGRSGNSSGTWVIHRFRQTHWEVGEYVHAGRRHPHCLGECQAHWQAVLVRLDQLWKIKSKMTSDMSSERREMYHQSTRNSGKVVVSRPMPTWGVFA